MTETKKQLQALLRSHRNAIFTDIQAKGFVPSDFNLSEQILNNGRFRSSTVRHHSTAFYFTITVSSTDVYSVGFSPGQSFRVKDSAGPPLNWGGVMHYLGIWLHQLVEEVQTPDLWSTVAGDTQLLKLAGDQDHRPFTPDEQLQVKKVLNEIKAYLIKNHNPSGSARNYSVTTELSRRCFD